MAVKLLRSPKSEKVVCQKCQKEIFMPGGMGIGECQGEGHEVVITEMEGD